MATVIEKLKLNKYATRVIMDVPTDMKEFEGLAYENELQKADLLIFFVYYLAQMVGAIQNVVSQQLLSDEGYLYFAYPKKASKKYTAKFGRDDIFPFLGINHLDGKIGETNLKFSKMVSLNNDFTMIGIRVITVKTARKQTVAQFVDRTDEFIALLTAVEKDHFEAITPGRQRAYVSYAFGAKTQATIDAHTAKAKLALAQGLGSVEELKK
ncbi:hypothetical protein EQG49_06990 [Periweissella cryptocerci]|uniref:Uncharacterized protein n=1 Tax=Periweissella cryptocerci TaxID=2506420 RepID=A0A4P6YU27_9LACO|nr:YdeI/OmpD-associated family protein [Periweissella cryptocerci]QBO36220.1 hypothetical protein EQG49_06990 [Periweissella cryptocerci]